MSDTRIKGQGLQTLAAGAMWRVEPSDRGDEQKIFAVANLDTVAKGNVLVILDLDGVAAGIVFPQQQVTLETNSGFILQNGITGYTAPTPGSIPAVVGQIFIRPASATATASRGSAGAPPPSGGGGSAPGSPPGGSPSQPNRN